MLCSHAEEDSELKRLSCMQDLEVQNNELVEANEKLQKEMGLLRTVAKEALLEKKKSQSALESLKHQVVHLLGEHNMLPGTQGQQGTLKQDPAVTGQHNAMFRSVSWVLRREVSRLNKLD